MKPAILKALKGQSQASPSSGAISNRLSDDEKQFQSSTDDKKSFDCVGKVYC
jgi:hypothetical protein